MLKQEDKVKKFYQTYDFEKIITNTPPLIQKFIDEEIKLLKRAVKKDFSILEIGCGYGRLLKILSPQVRDITGIDFSETLLQKAQHNISKIKNVLLFLMNAKELRFKDGIFDFTFCVNATFGNMPRIETQVISEMKRVTKIGGKILITVFSENARDAQVYNYQRLGFSVSKETANAVFLSNGLYSRRFSRNDFIKLFKGVGLECEIIKFCRIGYFVIGAKTADR